MRIAPANVGPTKNEPLTEPVATPLQSNVDISSEVQEIKPSTTTLQFDVDPFKAIYAKTESWSHYFKRLFLPEVSKLRKKKRILKSDS